MTNGLVLYIGFAQPDEWRHWAGTYATHAEKFEKTSGKGCLVVPFNLAAPELIDKISPDAVVLSGFARSFQDYEISTFRPICTWLQREDSKTPTLALCGSHQLLGHLFNNEMDTDRLYDAPMRRLEPGEPITNPEYHPEYFMEKGFYTLNLTDAGYADPILGGFERAPIVYESHYCEIKRLPVQFELLASSPECQIQAMRHRHRPLYGFQFHPEDSNERLADGMTMLTRFFHLLGKR